MYLLNKNRRENEYEILYIYSEGYGQYYQGKIMKYLFSFILGFLFLTILLSMGIFLQEVNAVSSPQFIWMILSYLPWHLDYPTGLDRG